MAGEPPKSVRWNPVSKGYFIPVESKGKLAETYVANFAGPVSPIYEYEGGTFNFPTGVRRNAYTHTRYPPKGERRPIRSAENAEAARIRATQLWGTGILTLPSRGTRSAEPIAPNSSASSALLGPPIQITNNDYFPEPQKSDKYHDRRRHNINSENFNSVNAELLANISSFVFFQIGKFYLTRDPAITVKIISKSDPIEEQRDGDVVLLLKEAQVEFYNNNVLTRQAPVHLGVLTAPGQSVRYTIYEGDADEERPNGNFTGITEITGPASGGRRKTRRQKRKRQRARQSKRRHH